MLARLSLKTVAAGAALAAAGMLLAPATASAQAYSYQGAPQNYGNQQPYGYDRYDDQSSYGYQDRGYAEDYRSDRYCRNERSNRQGAGLAIGATLGAVAGSQMAARGRRTEGSVLGGVLGAVVGAGVGGSSAGDCGRGYAQPRYGYNDRAYARPSYGYDNGGYERQAYGDPYRSDDRYDDRYDDRGYQYQQNDGYRSDCGTVAVTTRDSYGRTVTRYQESC